MLDKKLNGGMQLRMRNKNVRKQWSRSTWGAWIVLIGALVVVIHYGWITVLVWTYGIQQAHYIFPGTIDTFYSTMYFFISVIIGWVLIQSDLEED